MKPKKALISYSHKDNAHREALQSALAPAVRAGELEIWSDHQVLPGRSLDDEILSQLKEADVIVLLVSPDFIASDYCFTKELQIALERHSNGRAVLVPVMVRPTDWQGMPFAHLLMLPYDARAVTTWGNSDEAWLNVAQGIRRLLASIAAERIEPQVFRSKNMLATLIEVFHSLQERYENPEMLPGIGFGLSELDDLTNGISPGELALIASRPDHGHVELVVALCEHLVWKTKKKTLIFSQRLAADQLTNRLLCALGRISRFRFARSTLEDDDWSRVTAAIRVLRDADITIVDEPIRSCQALKDRLDVAKQERFEVLIIDGLEYMSAGSEEGALSLLLADQAKRHRQCVVSTVTLGSDLEGRAVRDSLLSDLGSWRVMENIASKILLSERPAEYSWSGLSDGTSAETCHVSLQKSPDGMTGTVALKYWPEYGVLEDFPEQAPVDGHEQNA